MDRPTTTNIITAILFLIVIIFFLILIYVEWGTPIGYFLIFLLFIIFFSIIIYIIFFFGASQPLSQILPITPGNGPVDNIKYGDIIQLNNVGNNKYVIYCFNAPNRNISNTYYLSATSLISGSWRITGKPDGTPVLMGDSISFANVDTTHNLQGNYPELAPMTGYISFLPGSVSNIAFYSGFLRSTITTVTTKSSTIPVGTSLIYNDQFELVYKVPNTDTVYNVIVDTNDSNVCGNYINVVPETFKIDQWKFIKKQN